MPAGPTYKSIAYITLPSTLSSITFNNIPQTYTDLVLVGNVNTTASLDYWYRLNSDTGTNYSNTRIVGDGSTTSSSRAASASLTYFNISATTGQHSFIMNLMNYSNTTTNKTQFIRYDSANLSTILRIGLWRSTAAITSITIQTDSSTFTSGSTFNLYGIAAA